MKYFGKKSLSSVVSVILHVSWYFVLVFSIAALIFGGMMLFFKPLQDIIASEMTKANSSTSLKEYQEWLTFINLPAGIKIIVLPYVGAIAVLLLLIIKKSQLLFSNFKNDVLFNDSNVQIISNISKLNIAFSILTFSLSSLLVSVLLFMVCEIFKKGSALQEEHDLTV